jgi:hypothetical protein
MRSRRILIVFVLALALVTPGAWAGESRPQAASSPAGILQQVWSWFTGLWSLTENAGWSIDPLGSQSDEGPDVDPLGCPHPTSDAGWEIDPLG